MRYQTYFTVVGDKPLELFFEREHFTRMGIPYIAMGMPEYESLQLINKMNKEGQGRYTYWLGEGR